MDRRERKKDLPTNMNRESDMDIFLYNLGLYRKPIAKDGSCLFRAVAEQIFNCQAEHLRVRKECIEYMKKNKDRFEAFVEGPFDHHLFNLRSQKEWAGQVEIQALSMMYKCDFVVYKDINSAPIKATENNYEKQIILCYSNGNHYDSIYPEDHKKNFAFCQSVVFELLYGKVFPHVIVKDPESKATSPTDENSKQCDFGESSLVNGYASGNENGDQGWTTVKSKKQGKMLTKKQKSVDNSEQTLLSPLSSKWNWEVMRSIDPDHYRNVELEVWEESRKEQQQKDQAVAATIQFKKGERCQVRHPRDENLYMAVIDEILEEKCKIWIPELKQRMLISFSRLKPKEQNANSGYRDLSGYYRKHENSQDNNSPRGGDDQKVGRRKKPNRNRKGNATDANERSQQEMPSQEGPSSKLRDNKPRRRRSNNNNARNKEEKKEMNQKEDGSSSQDQGSAFPALPKRDEQTTTEKPKDDFDNNPDPAAFWRKRREVEQMERADPGDDSVVSPVTTKHSSLVDEHEDNSEDHLAENRTESVESERCETPSEAMGEESSQGYPHELYDKNQPDEIHQELPGESVQEILKNFKPQEQIQELPTGITRVVPEEVAGIKLVTNEKRVNWQDLQPGEEKSTMYSNDDNRFNNYENMDVNKHSIKNLTNEETTKPVYMDNRSPLKDFVVEMGDDENVAEEQRYEAVNRNLFDPQRNFEILKNPDRQDVQGYVQTETAITENEINVEQVTREQEKLPVFQMTDHTVQGNETPVLVNQNDRQDGETIQATENPDHTNHHPITAATIQNEILNGSITYSNDPEGKDLPKDMEIVRHVYNYGIYMFQYFNGVNNVFSGTAPLSPMYSVMNPNAMYAMQQSLQNRAMMIPQSMYSQMQQPAHDDTQHQQNLGEETHESDSPGYKPSIPHHHSPSYHPMAAAQQQAMLNMNYGQMFAAAGRPIYSNYNLFHQRSPFPRYSTKVNFNRQMGRKYKYTRNDNQPNVKLQNLQTGYGQYPKEAE